MTDIKVLFHCCYEMEYKEQLYSITLNQFSLWTSKVEALAIQYIKTKIWSEQTSKSDNYVYNHWNIDMSNSLYVSEFVIEHMQKGEHN